MGACKGSGQGTSKPEGSAGLGCSVGRVLCPSCTRNPSEVIGCSGKGGKNTNYFCSKNRKQLSINANIQFGFRRDLKNSGFFDLNPAPCFPTTNQYRLLTMQKHLPTFLQLFQSWQRAPSLFCRVNLKNSCQNAENTVEQ